MKKNITEYSRPPLLFLHGAGLNRAMWQPQIQRLGNKHQIHAIDLPGHGQNKDRKFTLVAAVESIAELITNKQLDNVIIIGLSLGGYVAMAFAARYPQRVAGLVLSGCSIQYFGVTGYIARINALLTKLLPYRLFSHVQKRMICAAAGFQVYEEMQGVGFSKSGAIQGTLSVLKHDFVHELQYLPVPIMIMNGERDSLNRRNAERMFSSAGQSVVITLPDCGHLCSLENPDGFSGNIQQFCESLDT